MKRPSLILAAACALLGACRGKHHVDATAPVRGYLQEVGGSVPPQYRAYFTGEISEKELGQWTESLRAAVLAYGRDAVYEVLSGTGSEALVRVQFPGDEECAFTAAVTKRWSGWWITNLDTTQLRVPPPATPTRGSWWRRGDGG
ncbi:MAG: hypothetical protein HYY17_05825 [Planctomycetes bacterium]|nr:hypothetical protein [Planctomycetota bacterium]